MDITLILIILVAFGFVTFLFSVIFRRRKKLRLLLLSLGILFGVIPVLLYASFHLWGFIQEREYVGTYVAVAEDVGKVELKVFENNTFEIKADSCSQGFVQGTWNWSYSTDQLDFESTSQVVGSANTEKPEMLAFTNVPICLKLAKQLRFIKTSVETGVPKEEFTY